MPALFRLPVRALPALGTVHRRKPRLREQRRARGRGEVGRPAVEKYEPVGCYGEMPTAKEQKLAYREAAKADLAAGRVVRA